MRLGVIGAGYVGLVSAAGFSDFGNDVVCVDRDRARVDMLRDGEIPIYEPGLAELVKTNAAAGRLRFSTDIAEAVRDADVVFIAVGTPPAPDGSADLSQVLAVAAEIGKSLTRASVIVTKSTVPVGTSDKVRAALGANPHHAHVASNPEFLKEGAAVADFMRPDRVVVGIGHPSFRNGVNEEGARETMRRLYAPIVRTNDRLLFTDVRSAEMIKYASNAYLATRISFINSIATLCEKVGADVEYVRRGMGMDTRIGPSFLFPGIGYGGSCFPKDVSALVNIAAEHGVGLPIVQAAQEINDGQRTIMLDKIIAHLGGQKLYAPSAFLEGKTIAVWGLAFKPETDDVREAPALDLVERLLRAGANVNVSDPIAMPNAMSALNRMGLLNGDLSLCPSGESAAHGADALVLCTEWRQYRQPDFRRLREIMRGDGIFDGRNIWDPGQVREAGFCYYGVGRP